MRGPRNPARGGPLMRPMFDVHTLQQRFYFGDGIVPVLLTAMGLLLQCVGRTSLLPCLAPSGGKDSPVLVD